MRPRPHQFLALLPVIALVGAPFFANRVTPRIFGLPLLLSWTVGAVLLAALVMAIIVRLDERDRVARRSGRDAA